MCGSDRARTTCEGSTSYTRSGSTVVRDLHWRLRRSARSHAFNLSRRSIAPVVRLIVTSSPEVSMSWTHGWWTRISSPIDVGRDSLARLVGRVGGGQPVCANDDDARLREIEPM